MKKKQNLLQKCALFYERRNEKWFERAESFPLLIINTYDRAYNVRNTVPNKVSFRVMNQSKYVKIVEFQYYITFDWPEHHSTKQVCFQVENFERITLFESVLTMKNFQYQTRFSVSNYPDLMGACSTLEDEMDRNHRYFYTPRLSIFKILRRLLSWLGRWYKKWLITVIINHGSQNTVSTTSSIEK